MSINWLLAVKRNYSEIAKLRDGSALISLFALPNFHLILIFFFRTLHLSCHYYKEIAIVVWASCVSKKYFVVIDSGNAK